MKNWKVGSITAGVLLIAIGILYFLQNFISLPYTKLLLNAWPIACILLGIEILVFHLIRKEDSLRFSWFSIILLICVMFASIAFNFGHIAIKQLGINLKSTTVDINEEQNIPNDINEIIIDAPDGKVNVLGTNSQALKVNGSMRIPTDNKKDQNGQLEDYFSIKKLGNKLYVKCEEDKYSFITFHDSEAKLNIELPKDISTKINVDNGSIDLQNKSNKTEVEIDDGEMKLEDVSGYLIANANNGSISIRNVELSDNSKITADDGAVDIENIKGKLDVKVANGSITVNKANVTEESQVTTEDGNISIMNIVGSIDMTSSQGTIKLSQANLKDRSKITTEDGNLDIDDFIGELYAQTSNGSITIDEANLIGNSQITSEDGNIQLNMRKQQDVTIKAEKEDGSFEGNIGWKSNKNEEENRKQTIILGEGTNQLFIKTSNGNIIVNK
ncbi:DUF4097 family beta strand repeat-containing protein [Gottfriedia solisilvae]|uniref:Adhesin domain-containing protein n=1 Tax=Gottfriedia solisilvae TaxID=1516104 RepID=A0A8J3EX87_9BACI|nr:DUF4097 family beta strand repeat-containing protein [Gottfriedia solisilvae]GGI14765.1 hypothetical protein GCM10007380_24590 [Gottfriedia solisilvae]